MFNWIWTHAAEEGQVTWSVDWQQPNVIGWQAAAKRDRLTGSSQTWSVDWQQPNVISWQAAAKRDQLTGSSQTWSVNKQQLTHTHQSRYHQNNCPPPCDHKVRINFDARVTHHLHVSIVIIIIVCDLLSGEGEEFSIFHCSSPFYYLLIEFHCTFSIPYKMLQYYVYYYYILIR